MKWDYDSPMAIYVAFEELLEPRILGGHEFLVPKALNRDTWSGEFLGSAQEMKWSTYI
jgi:hypothetical protein